jgi:hypothetical protein
MIVKAAIKYPDGEVLTAHRHYQIIAIQAKLGISTKANCTQGFVDTAGNFLNREEAKVIAIKNGQIKSDHEGELYSEDLWPDPTGSIL